MGDMTPRPFFDYDNVEKIIIIYYIVIDEEKVEWIFKVFLLVLKLRL